MTQTTSLIQRIIDYYMAGYSLETWIPVYMLLLTIGAIVFMIWYFTGEFINIERIYDTKYNQECKLSIIMAVCYFFVALISINGAVTAYSWAPTTVHNKAVVIAAAPQKITAIRNNLIGQVVIDLESGDRLTFASSSQVGAVFGYWTSITAKGNKLMNEAAELLKDGVVFEAVHTESIEVGNHLKIPVLDKLYAQYYE